ncbi:unnamed protein product [Kuraishia capsulata CBS 1993]|uniref:Dolichol phosphate-mannose biosynthesis regulatory protein n=1 Tax=Kuraishia capsulata CBS 1993 TaxID=1382522 RepID=W6MKI8_9ASCO|nr:uncharacterized protein KUCA_T00001199001 [Kuraishia capsulata CBS 1993]CDK25232.1 unnamed protein product [Kuraishia capsulata CBS 1993]
MLLASSLIFAYYTVWTFAVPFLDDSNPLQQLFPAREWIIKIPVILLITGVSLVASFIGFVLIKSSKKKKN